MARPIVLKSILFPVLACAFLFQLSLPLARIATTYTVLDLNISVVYISLISASFALLPAIFAIPLGRLYDRGYTRPAMITGACLGPISVLTLLLGKSSVLALIAGTMLMGVVQSVIVSALQLLVVRSAGLHHRDRVIGLHMVALSIGSLAAPVLLSVIDHFSLPLASSLLGISLCGTLALLLGILIAARAIRRTRQPDLPQVPVRELLRVPRLLPLVILGSGYLTTLDFLFVFMPVLGVERNISPGTIGLMIGTQAAGSIMARALFGTLSARLGRERLLLAATLVSAAAMIGIGMPAPLAVTWISLAVAGMSLSLAMTSSVSLVVYMAPPAARGTALSLRFTANRLIQFTIPLASTLVIASVGAAGIFMSLGLVLSASAGGLWRVLSRPRRD